MSTFWQDNSNSNQQSNYNGGAYEFVERKFDKDKLNNYFDNADYYGAANYLESLTTKDVKSRIELNKKIRELRRMAEHQEGFVNNIRREYGKDATDAYVFLHKLKNGASMDINDPNIDDNIKNNKFIKDYSAINDLYVANRNKSGQLYIPDTLQIELYGNGANLLEQELLNSKELQGKTLKDFGILKTKDGLNVDIHSPYLDVVFRKLNSVNDELEGQDKDDNFVSDFIEVAKYMVMLGDTDKPKEGSAPYGSTDRYYKLYLCNTQNNIKEDITDSERHKDLLKIKDALGSAKSLEKQYNEQFSKKNVIEETYVSQFLGAGHIQAYNMLKNGKIDIDDYNKIVKERQETYDRLIQQTDLTQYKVYATDVESDNTFESIIDSKIGPGAYAEIMGTKKRDETSMHELDNYDRRDLTKDLLVAIKDKRVTYSAAMVGGEMGTYITITPDIDEKTGRPKEGSSAKYRRIFIPHLFESSCEEALNADTRSMAVRDLTDISRYNYIKTLSDGNTLRYSTDGIIILNDRTQFQEGGTKGIRGISKDEALLLLDRDNAIDQSVDAILAQLGDSYNKKDADTLAQYAAEAIVNNLYKNINRGDRELEISRVYTSILKGLKIK